MERAISPSDSRHSLVQGDEGCAHLVGIDRHSLVQEDADYHGGDGLEAAPDADVKYDPFALNG